MTEPHPWAKISAYVAENRIKMVLEANLQQEKMAFEANNINHGKTVP
jgi:hypothetical protein